MKAKAKTYAESVLKTGPQRVVINHEGEALSAKRAEQEGHQIDIIFIRDDGWSLGASAELADVAYKLWENEWIGWIRRPSPTLQPMRAYTCRR